MDLWRGWDAIDRDASEEKEGTTKVPLSDASDEEKKEAPDEEEKASEEENFDKATEMAGLQKFKLKGRDDAAKAPPPDRGPFRRRDAPGRPGRGKVLDRSRRRMDDRELMRLARSVDDEDHGYDEIDLSRNQLTDGAVSHILEICKRSSELKILKLFNNQLGDQGAEELGQLFRFCHGIEEVHLSHNHFTEKGEPRLHALHAVSTTDGHEGVRKDGHGSTLQDYAVSISSCARSKLWKQALRLLELMPKAKLRPNVIIYSAGISACEKGGNWELALNLLSTAMPRAKVQPNAFSYNAAISACEKGGQLQHALALFEAMPIATVQPDVFSFSAVISAYEKGGQWEAALTFFQSMPDVNVWPNLFCYSAAISACESGSQWQQALEFFQTMPQAHVQPNVVTFSAAISACEKGNRWPQALKLFESMSIAKVQRNVVTYNAAISACRSGRNGKKALGLLNHMSQANILSNVITYNATISSCEKHGQWQDALKLLFTMSKLQVRPDLISYDAAISACEKGGQWQLPLTLFQVLLKASHHQPKAITYNAIISSCEKGNQWHQALQVFEAMQWIVEPDLISYSASVSACEKGNQWQQARKCLEVSRQSNVQPDVVLYNSTISACDSSCGQWHEGLIFFEALLRETLRASDISYNAAISSYKTGELALGMASCSRSKLWKEALKLFQMMPKAQIQLNVILCSAAISACEKGGNWELALNLFSTAMPEAKVQPNTFSYNAAISACEKVGRWEDALTLFAAMPSAVVEPDVLTCSALISALPCASTVRGTAGPRLARGGAFFGRKSQSSLRRSSLQAVLGLLAGRVCVRGMSQRVRCRGLDEERAEQLLSRAIKLREEVAELEREAAVHPRVAGDSEEEGDSEGRRREPEPIEALQRVAPRARLLDLPELLPQWLLLCSTFPYLLPALDAWRFFGQGLALRLCPSLAWEWTCFMQDAMPFPDLLPMLEILQPLLLFAMPAIAVQRRLPRLLRFNLNQAFVIDLAELPQMPGSRAILLLFGVCLLYCVSRTACGAFPDGIPYISAQAKKSMGSRLANLAGVRHAASFEAKSEGLTQIEEVANIKAKAAEQQSDLILAKDAVDKLIPTNASITVWCSLVGSP
eukprot:g24331.t1